jgi:hypothetical protein
MKIIGIILLILGLLGLLIYGIQAVQDTETFSILGIDFGVSDANWTPVIISAILFIIGLVLSLSSSRTKV